VAPVWRDHDLVEFAAGLGVDAVLLTGVMVAPRPLAAAYRCGAGARGRNGGTPHPGSRRKADMAADGTECGC
jgi:hypothetical protein